MASSTTCMAQKGSWLAVRMLTGLLVGTALIAGCANAGSKSGSAPPTSVASGGVGRSPSATAGIPGCEPECSTGLADPGELGPGDYTTQYFLAGHLKVTYNGAWVSHEDQGVEFSSAPIGMWDVHRVSFWVDIVPVAVDQQTQAGVAETVRGWLRWLQHRENLTVSVSHSTSIGADRIPAKVVDIAIAKNAKSEDPGCPDRACVNLLTWPNAGGNDYGLGGSGVLRLYLADVAYGGRNHLLAVAVQSQSPSDMKGWLSTAVQMISTARAPVTAA